MNFRRLACLALVLSLSTCSTPARFTPRRIDTHHLVRFENEYVRVTETRIEPGDETLPHSHPGESLIIFLTGGKLRITNDDGTSHESSLEADTVAVGSAPAVHRTANIGATTARTVAVKILSQSPDRGVEPADSPGTPLLDNEKFHVSRIRLSRGDAVHLIGSTPSVFIALNQGTIVTGSLRTALNPGWPLWCEAKPLALRYDSGGTGTFEAIIVTLKPASDGTSRPGG